ncbi:MAG: hypothetical protein KDA70_22395, partial [Planctomycetaceae bacterium]|nr:hypothetical protein [Planctomycetaceae bacterium]
MRSLRLFVAFVAVAVVMLACTPARVSAQAAESGITHGPLSGEVTADGVTLWARGAGAGDLVFAVTTADGAETVATATVPVDEATDFAGKARIDG